MRCAYFSLFDGIWDGTPHFSHRHTDKNKSRTYYRIFVMFSTFFFVHLLFLALVIFNFGRDDIVKRLI